MGPALGFWPRMRPKHCKLQCSGHVGFWGALREPSVPYNWTSGAFGTFGPIWSQPGPGEVFSETPLRRHEVARGGSQSLRESRRAPKPKPFEKCSEQYTIHDTLSLRYEEERADHSIHWSRWTVNDALCMFVPILRRREWKWASHMWCMCLCFVCVVVFICVIFFVKKELQTMDH